MVPKTIFFSEITKSHHKLSKTFYFIKIYVLTGLMFFFYIVWYFFAKKCHFQPYQPVSQPWPWSRPWFWIRDPWESSTLTATGHWHLLHYCQKYNSCKVQPNRRLSTYNLSCLTENLTPFIPVLNRDMIEYQQIPKSNKKYKLFFIYHCISGFEGTSYF